MNNGLFSEGAYQWALLESRKYRENNPCEIDLGQMFKSIESRQGQDVKISIFEPQLNKDAPPILMLEWIGKRKEKISFYPLEKRGYEKMKEKSRELLEIFKMSGRIRYQEELDKGIALTPMIIVAS